MKILALEKNIPGVTGEQFTPQILKEEALKVWELQQQGIIREIYFRADRRDAVLILECNNVNQAEQYLNTLPLVSHNLVEFDIIPLAPYTGFARLFGEES